MERIKELINGVLQGQMSAQSVEEAIACAFATNVIDQENKELLLDRLAAARAIGAVLSLIYRERDAAALQVKGWPDSLALGQAETVQGIARRYFDPEEVLEVERRLKDLRVLFK